MRRWGRSATKRESRVAATRRDLVRRSRGGTSGERKTKTVCHCHELRTFAPLGRSHTSAPFFATMNVPSMKHSERSSLPRSFEIAGERFQHPLQRALAHPALEAPVAGLVRRVPLGQVGPLGPRAQDPQDAVQHLAAARARAVPVRPPAAASRRSAAPTPSIARPSGPSLLHPPDGCSLPPIYEMTSSYD